MRASKEYFSVFRVNDFCLGLMGLSHICFFFTPDPVYLECLGKEKVSVNLHLQIRQNK